MKLSTVAAFLASVSLSIACEGQGTYAYHPNGYDNGYHFNDLPPIPGLPYRATFNNKPATFNNKPTNFNSKPVTLNKKPSTLGKPTQKTFRRAPEHCGPDIPYPRNAPLAARGYYDDEAGLDSLYARDSELDEGLLYRRGAEEYYDLLDLETRDVAEEYVTLLTNGNGSLSSGGAGGPHLPAGLDSSAYHMFLRLNTIPKAYPPFGSVDHAGLNELMADLGGQHVDVVYGNPWTGFNECGLVLVDMAWTKTHSNADGYPVMAQCSRLYLRGRDEYTYVGQYSGGNVERLCKAVHLTQASARIMLEDC
ncbi:hypothetical protein MMC26_001121 [Xylographa opegraphella]|nr:hypothetical protein [Xylographa opegraphella]